jgi:hypothetical protein
VFAPLITEYKILLNTKFIGNINVKKANEETKYEQSNTPTPPGATQSNEGTK